MAATAAGCGSATAPARARAWCGTLPPGTEGSGELAIKGLGGSAYFSRPAVMGSKLYFGADGALWKTNGDADDRLVPDRRPHHTSAPPTARRSLAAWCRRDYAAPAT